MISIPGHIPYLLNRKCADSEEFIFDPSRVARTTMFRTTATALSLMAGRRWFLSSWVLPWPKFLGHTWAILTPNAPKCEDGVQKDLSSPSAAVHTHPIRRRGRGESGAMAHPHWADGHQKAVRSECHPGKL